MTVFPTPQFDRTGGEAIVTSPYGTRWGRLHAATDVGTRDGMDVGTPNVANDPGVVIRQSRDPGVGAGTNLWLLTDRIDRINGIEYQVGYKNFHLNRVTVPTGFRAEEGEQIAEVGTTGTSAAHLHQQKHRLRVGYAHDWSDKTAVSHTAELQYMLDTKQFAGRPSVPAPPAQGDEDVPLSADDIKAFKDALGPYIRDEINTVQAKWEEDTRAILTGSPVVRLDGDTPPEGGLWLLRPDASGRMVRSWIDGPWTLRALRETGIASPAAERYIPDTIWEDVTIPQPWKNIGNPAAKFVRSLPVVPLV